MVMLSNNALTDGVVRACHGMHWFAHLKKKEKALESFFFFNNLKKGSKTF